LPDEDPIIWNRTINPRSYRAEQIEYQHTILEQYKLYVEMADRTSQRRGVANTFFLTFNTALTTAAATFLSTRSVSSVWLIFPLVTAIIECAFWFLLIRSYRMLSSRKFRIINIIETKLPASPWQSEWTTLGMGVGVWRYWRLTLLEQFIPVIFILVYICGYCAYAFR
jgi:hypothetical protein